ncbi:hypothetical protein A3D76_01375 [Candidatus Roizmanbacteria bacterium RIFCSPHIGHO2_02_FULL_37_9b]|nr:MAG: hypothetical protein A3D76_01375 [Candidatus Roizmanbacteria bacterium RIFCSPHIGHO2_02_FULL_37_9b]
MKKIPYTREGLSRLYSEYELLEKKRKPALEDLKSAREKGDLSENSAYRAARFKLSSIDNRLRSVKSLIDKAYIIENKNIEFVDIGTYVTITDDKNISQTFRIVNTFESDISKGQISYYSPLGKELMGKKINDKVSVTTPSGIKNYLIKSISLEIK